MDPDHTASQHYQSDQVPHCIQKLVIEVSIYTQQTAIADSIFRFFFFITGQGLRFYTYFFRTVLFIKPADQDLHCFYTHDDFLAALNWLNISWHSMHGSRKFCQRGSSNFDNVFLVEGREDLNQTNTAIRGPSSTRQRRNWRADDGPTSNADLAALRFSGDPDQYC